ncbi:adat3 [Symbiodinium natans]|uniref:Adat3 protein n=1 Tax=Symbiodinium natans TaxID=878477 RepID=A0A812IA83_9DINO|nr:adat3 [Symbiodinium natans]
MAEDPNDLVELLPCEFTRQVELAAFHCTMVPKVLCGELLKLLQSRPLAADFQHLLRVRKPEDDPEQRQAGLEVLLNLATSDFAGLDPALAEFLQKHGASVETVHVPRHGALTPVQLRSFSRHWPVKNLKSSFEPLKLTEALKTAYTELLRRAEEVAQGASGCIIARRKEEQKAEFDILATARSEVSEAEPLRHPTMAAIGAVAARAKAASDTKRPREEEEYLCYDCEVVLTHEPCVMCAMALVHSRVRVVAFHRVDSHFGGLGGAISLHQCASLNHQFRVLRWEAKATSCNLPTGCCAGSRP